MARSLTGGTRGFLRGRVANDLYQVTKNVQGKRVQLVRAVEDSRIYSNTIEQALARMKMACLMRSLAQLKQLVDHSWEGVPYGQLSIAHFVKVNMPYLNWDAYCNWSARPCFMLPHKANDSYLLGAFQISSGNLPDPSWIVATNILGSYGYSQFKIHLTQANPKFGDLKALMGLNANDYITLVIQGARLTGLSAITDAALFFLRLYLSENILDDTPISSANVQSIFYYEGNCTYRVNYVSSSRDIIVELYLRDDAIARQGFTYAIVTSRWNGVVWQRNNARFLGENGVWQEDMSDGVGYQVFHDWFPEWNPESGYGPYDWEFYPAAAPDNWRAVPNADAQRDFPQS